MASGRLRAGESSGGRPRASASLRRLVRLLAVAYPLVLCELAVAAFAADVLRLAPARVGGIAGLGAAAVSPGLVLAAWLLEATALIALFLLVGRGGGDGLRRGLLVGSVAWMFRGPLTQAALATSGVETGGWPAALFAWGVYAAIGLTLAHLGRRPETGQLEWVAASHPGSAHDQRVHDA